MSSSVLGRLVRQDKDLEVLGGVTAGELGEELDGAAQGQVGRSLARRGRCEPPAHGPCLNIRTLRADSQFDLLADGDRRRRQWIAQRLAAGLSPAAQLFGRDHRVASQGGQDVPEP